MRTAEGRNVKSSARNMSIADVRVYRLVRANGLISAACIASQKAIYRDCGALRLNTDDLARAIRKTRSVDTLTTIFGLICKQYARQIRI